MIAVAVDFERSRSPATVRQYRMAFAQFLDFLDEDGRAGATVADLSRDMLSGFYAHLGRGRHGHARSSDTRRRLVEKIEAAWRWLFDEEWHPSVPRPRTIDMPREVRAPVVAPTFDEMAACVLACVSEGPRRLATVLYYTGVRVDQAMALDWSQVDLDRALLTLPPHKGLPGRIVPMSPHLVDELARWGRREGQVLGWLVTRIVRERRLAEAWARAGVREAAWTGVHRRHQSHAFRRGLVTGLHHLGAVPEDVEVFVGHSVKGSRAHYREVDPEHLRTVAALVPPIRQAKQLAILGVS